MVALAEVVFLAQIKLHTPAQICDPLGSQVKQYTAPAVLLTLPCGVRTIIIIALVDLGGEMNRGD